MHIIGKAKKVTIYVGESDRWGRKSLHMAILEMLKKEQCAGATVSRGLAGFGAHSQIKTASLVALSSDLPLIIEWVDNPARVERVMPRLLEMITEGLVTVQDVDVTFYSHRDLHHLSAFVPVQDVMSQKVHTISAAAPLADAAKRLLGQVQKSLLVVNDQGRVIGILTDGDLLRRANLLSASARQHFTKSEIEAELQRLRQQAQTVRDMMTPHPTTVAPDMTIPQAVTLMLEHNIKRLPVVDAEGQPVGVVSRVDVLRAFAQPLAVEAPRRSPQPGQRDIVEGVMSTNVPAVPMHAPLTEVVNLLVTNVQRRVIVIDSERRVVGIVTDGDLINRAAPTERTGIIQSLTRRLTVGQAEDYGLGRRTVAEVMTQPVVTVSPDTPLPKALHLLLEHRVKRLPVIDGKRRLVGLVGRAGILQALGQ